MIPSAGISILEGSAGDWLDKAVSVERSKLPIKPGENWVGAMVARVQASSLGASTAGDKIGGDVRSAVSLVG